MTCFTGHGEYYAGTMSYAYGHVECKFWNKTNVPSEISKNYDSSLQENYCRNPDNLRSRPWCYINESTLQWNYCNISNCQNPPFINTTNNTTTGMLITFTKSIAPSKCEIFNSTRHRYTGLRTVLATGLVLILNGTRNEI